jgi:hypothetical protein
LSVHPVARFVLALVLAVAVPWNALAAATAGACGPSSHVPHPSFWVAESHGASLATHAEHHGTVEPAKAKCGAGAACCAAVAPPPKTMGVMAAVAVARFASAGQARFPAFLTPGLERPPRPVVA